jgi:hypothetical protein
MLHPVCIPEKAIFRRHSLPSSGILVLSNDLPDFIGAFADVVVSHRYELGLYELQYVRKGLDRRTGN